MCAYLKITFILCIYLMLLRICTLMIVTFCSFFQEALEHTLGSFNGYTPQTMAFLWAEIHRYLEERTNYKERKNNYKSKHNTLTTQTGHPLLQNCVPFACC